MSCVWDNVQTNQASVYSINANAAEIKNLVDWILPLKGGTKPS
jgi:hypothetical protein